MSGILWSAQEAMTMIAQLNSQPLFQCTRHHSTTKDKESQVLSNIIKISKYFTYLLLSGEQEGKRTFS